MTIKTLFKKSDPVTAEFSMKAMHYDIQKIRKNAANGDGADLTLKGYLAEVWGAEMSPERFYRELGVDLKGMTVEKMLNTSELNRWLFPEIVRDAIIKGLFYTPFYGALVTGEESINSTGLTMPSMDFTVYDKTQVQLRDVNEGATITEGQIVTWQEKQVTIKKKGRGIKQTYESIMFTPLDLAAIFFEELGTQLGADLDADLLNIAFNGDQADGSQSSPVIGATTPGTLAYADISRAWIRFKRIGRNSSVMLVSEADAQTLFLMTEFQRTRYPGGVSPSPVTLKLNTLLPTEQEIYVHDAIPTGKIVMVDTARAFTQLTAMPLLIESEKIVSRQLNGEYVSIITGFANLFRDARLVLDYTSSLSTNPGPSVPIR
jgi:hypothetical protein